jgi:SAM-dependent methyltransferase
MDADRLAWIYSATNPAELRERYAAWAATYDDDMAGLDWSAPVFAAQRCAAHAGEGADVLDAGCGTGQVGEALRGLGVGRVTGFDLSPEMLELARRRGAYDELVEGPLLDPLPFEPGSFDAAVSSGVFTIGHVGPSALAHLATVVRPGGTVSITFRDDSVGPLGHEREAERLAGLGVWALVERSDPMPLIAERIDGVPTPVDMRVWTWRITTP